MCKICSEELKVKEFCINFNLEDFNNLCEPHLDEVLNIWSLENIMV